MAGVENNLWTRKEDWAYSHGVFLPGEFVDVNALTAEMKALAAGQPEFFFLQSDSAQSRVIMIRSVPSQAAFDNFIAALQGLNGAIRPADNWDEFALHEGYQKMWAIING